MDEMYGKNIFKKIEWDKDKTWIAYHIKISHKEYVILNSNFDCLQAQFLGMTYNEYRTVLLKHGAYFYQGLLEFDDRQKAIDALDELNPYLVMYELTNTE